MVLTLYLLAVLSLLVATSAVYGALLEPFPVSWLHRQYFLRMPLTLGLLGVSLAWVGWSAAVAGSFPGGAIFPLLLLTLAVLLAFRMHQSRVFPAIDFPEKTDHPRELPLPDSAEVAVIEYGGVTQAYSLDHLIHHHIINDRFGDKTVALTYCAMCRTVIPFDVSDIGPLFVGSFKNANLIVADRRTKTFFQQASFESIVGRLHPSTLTMIPFQILPWNEVLRLDPLPSVTALTEHDVREFQLPIPGLWRRLLAGEATPGLFSGSRDHTLSARTRVIGLHSGHHGRPVAFIKNEVIDRGVFVTAGGVLLVASGNTVNGFVAPSESEALQLSLDEDGHLVDASTETAWDLRGKHRRGSLKKDLRLFPLSDEYWFSWKNFHPESELIRLEG